jgi:hypothetical protein
MRDDLSRAGHELACAVLVLAVTGPREVAPHGNRPGQWTVVRRRPAARSSAKRASCQGVRWLNRVRPCTKPQTDRGFDSYTSAREYASAAIDAAKQAGVSHVVLMSAAGTREAPDHSIGGAYWTGEQHLIKTAPHWTILRMNYYAESMAEEIQMSLGMAS